MAIKIDIPGVGEVSVEGAAQESTMLEILAAVKQSEKTKQKAEKKVDTKAADEANKKLKETTSELDDVIHGLSNLEEAVTGSSKTMEYLERGVKATGTAALETTKGLVNFGASLTATAASVAVNLIKSFDDAAANPISAGAAMIDAGIDTALAVAKATTNAVGGVASGFLSAIPYVGAGLQKVGEAATAAAIAVEEMGAKILHTGNELMAKEFQKTADSMSKFSRAGASFAGGMSEMRNLATASGIGLSQFTEVVSKSRDSVTGMGLTTGEATEKLSKGLSSLSTVTNKSGRSMRDQMLAMGFSFEESGEVMAQYMAQQKTFGRDLDGILPEELAQGAKDYATNLKVLSDLTGQDAKKLMERAQAESMRGALAGQLSKDQNKAYQESFAMLSSIPDQGPAFSAALTQMLAGGVVTDPMIAGNKEAMDLIQKTAAQVSAGTADMTIKTQENMAKAGEAARASGKSMTDLSVVMLNGKAGAAAAGIAATGNALRNMRLDSDAGKKSMDAAKKQAESTDEVTTGFVTATEALTAFQNDMEKIAGDSGALKIYADTIGKTAEGTARMVQAAIGIATKGWSAADAKDFIDTGKAPGESGASEAPKEGTAGDWMDKAGSAIGGVKKWATSIFDDITGVAGKFESGNNAGMVSSGKGDAGGVSYGQFQLSSNTGDVDKFLKSSGYADQFKGLVAGTKEFGDKWKEIAKSDEGFGKAQKEHALSTHLNPQLAKLNQAGLGDVAGKGSMVQAAIFSTANQYGANTDKIINALKGKDTEKMSQEEIVNAIQDYKAANVESNFRSSSANVKEGVRNRIEEERALLLAQKPVSQEGVVKAEIATKPKDAYTDTANLVGNAVQQKLSEIDNIQTSADQMSAHTMKKQDLANLQTANNKKQEKPPSIAQANASLIDASQKKLDNIEAQQKNLKEHADFTQANAPQNSLIGKNDVIPEEPPHVQMIAVFKEMHHDIKKELKHGNSQREAIKKQNA